MNIKISNTKIKSIVTNSNLYIIGLVTINNKSYNLNKDVMKININDIEYDMKFIFKDLFIRNFFGKLNNIYISKIPITDLLEGKINNKIFFSYKNSNNTYMKKKVKYSRTRNKNKLLNSNIKKLKSINTSIYLRQSKNNSIFIMVRNINKTDYFLEQLKINIAYLISKICNKDEIIMYEKESSRYEESSSVLFESLVDKEYKNIYYILDKNYKERLNIEEKYRKNIINKHTFKHYLKFFNSKTLIGTEMPTHAIDLRIANKYAVRKLNNKFNYIFLQHGVMYMISLASKNREFFHKSKGSENTRVVVSSRLEAEHFVSNGNYLMKDIYICGLPKFDRNKWNKDANKIIIMPTWRPWEYNQARVNFTETRYYKMILKIYNSIPERYKDSIIILPHPIIANHMNKFESELIRYMNFEDKYDDLLKDAKVLITDYSSIAYDAFYRGSNVIFYWEEKDYCMDEYGEGTKLMLNEDNCFGDICYNIQELKQVIERNYLGNQKDEYIKRYRKIVEFHDGKNTERLIQYLKNDNLI